MPVPFLADIFYTIALLAGLAAISLYAWSRMRSRRGLREVMNRRDDDRRS